MIHLRTPGMDALPGNWTMTQSTPMTGSVARNALATHSVSALSTTSVLVGPSTEKGPPGDSVTASARM